MGFMLGLSKYPIMLLYILATFCIVSAAGFKVLDEDYAVLQSDFEELQWPETYTVKATRVSLTSKIVEDYSAWKTNESSRIDFNQGVVKLITNLDTLGYKKHEVRPETTETVLNKMVCHVHRDSFDEDDVTLDEILPKISEADYYEEVGNETIDDLETVKFEYIDKNPKVEIRNTVWAYYVDEFGWIPVRYEEKKFFVTLGSLYKHNIWTFYDFNVDFEINVFDIDQFGCDEERHIAPESDNIVKELQFIDPENEKHVDHVFNHFQKRFDRKYAHIEEEALRRTIFEKNMRMVTSVNRQNRGYKLGINQFSDRTPEELANSLGAIPRPEGKVGTVPFPYKESELKEIVSKLPKSYDMRLLGLVSPVKDQETCGSCWTFAATAVTESGLARVNGGRLLSLSNQAIVDCAYEHIGEMGAGGCNGGFDFIAYEWIQKHGLPTEEEYGPYKNQDGLCHIANMTKTYNIKGFTDVTKNNYEAMKAAVVNHGALFIYVNANEEFTSYSSGIFYQTKSECRPDRPNHAVTLVGYGERDGDLFWILKNSWGESWGIDGYMLVAARNNVCGIASKVSYPVF